MGSAARMRHIPCVIRAVPFNKSDPHNYHSSVKPRDLNVNMTSPSPLHYDTYYHIYNRGVNGENIFVEERNYDLFLRLFEKHLQPVTDLFAYCLLKNHFHLLIKTLRVPRKTLKVSTSNTRHDVHKPFRDPRDSSRAKPLGFENYASRQFSNFFNAYATRSGSTKPTGGQAIYSSIPLDVYQLLRIDSFGMLSLIFTRTPRNMDL